MKRKVPVDRNKNEETLQKVYTPVQERKFKGLQSWGFETYLGLREVGWGWPDGQGEPELNCLLKPPSHNELFYL